MAKRGFSLMIDSELYDLAKEHAWKNRMSFSRLMNNLLIECVTEDIGVKRAKVIAERSLEPGTGKRRASPA